jgi:hypothetical protein
VVSEEEVSVEDNEAPLEEDHRRIASSVASASGGYCAVSVVFTPTVPHCTLATLIGLCIRVKLNRELRKACKLDIFIKEGTHNNEHESTRAMWSGVLVWREERGCACVHVYVSLLWGCLYVVILHQLHM